MKKKLLAAVLAFLCVLTILNFGKIDIAKAEEAGVSHFFSHELVYSPERAYCKANRLRRCFDRDHLTASEFKKILEEWHSRGYVLVNIEDVYAFENGKWHEKKDVDLNGKKPIVLSFDDLTYDTRERGIVEKIVEKDGEIWDYTSCEEQQFTQERDGVTILEKFIEENPDFSFNGARAILCVTGYNGAFGHRVFEGTYLSGEKLEKEEESLKNLVALLKEKGYRFGCHSYSHFNCAYASAGQFREDLRKWQNEIGKYVGETNIYCYPGGNHKAQSQNNEFLKANGFTTFLCTGQSPTKGEENENRATYFYRHPLDGTSLRLCEKEYAKFFDARKVYEEKRYLPFSCRQGYGE